MTRMSVCCGPYVCSARMQPANWSWYQYLNPTDLSSHLSSSTDLSSHLSSSTDLYSHLSSSTDLYSHSSSSTYLYSHLSSIVSTQIRFPTLQLSNSPKMDFRTSE